MKRWWLWLIVAIIAAASSALAIDQVNKKRRIAEVQPQILRLTTPKLKSVWGPFRSG